MISTDELRETLRKACDAAGSQRAWAKANGVSAVYVCDCLAGRRAIGKAIARALGFQRVTPVTMYEKSPRERKR